jgi:hypothetical protein
MLEEEMSDLKNSLTNRYTFSGARSDQNQQSTEAINPRYTSSPSEIADDDTLQNEEDSLGEVNLAKSHSGRGRDIYDSDYDHDPNDSLRNAELEQLNKLVS